jgi:NAD(P)-dependent dehydrogenase (short-subunit alcohol dehydrogenase family)
MDLQLKDRLSLVTGSTAGIGYAIAEALASEGARVIINGRSQESVDKAIAKLAPKAAGEVLSFAGDLSEAEIAEQIAQKHPDVEILVNNLGIFEPLPFEDIPRLYLPSMKDRNWGRIVFISSESGVQIPAEMIHYGMTKTAQLAISRGLAESVAGTGITVNSVLPGPTKSRGVGHFVEELAKKEGKSFEEFEEEFFEKMRPTSLIKRFAAPEKVVSLVAYIVSPLASATTGAALRVDGGTVKSAF